ncbi:fimbrial biogenesis chaperone [Collimonas antrihumi]|uniref:fimbrial biogenesis chaperone n=1 Tax=Collimonas antrihumi TaxID=1940615 RepID=UPI001B8D24E4|nr:fimbria/pilus periplasmic chaperone [Collimonas antrihumi]
MKISFSKVLGSFCAVCLTGLLSAPAQADIVFSKTRAIYPMQEREITVTLSNENATAPRLMQAWIDDGDINGAPEQIDVPFTLTPPVFRMEAGKSQALRVVYAREDGKGKALPKDKESVFWLNVLAVPPRPHDAAVVVNKDVASLQAACFSISG